MAWIVLPAVKPKYGVALNAAKTTPTGIRALFSTTPFLSTQTDQRLCRHALHPAYRDHLLGRVAALFSVISHSPCAVAAAVCALSSEFVTLDVR